MCLRVCLRANTTSDDSPVGTEAFFVNASLETLSSRRIVNFSHFPDAPSLATLSLPSNPAQSQVQDAHRPREATRARRARTGEFEVDAVLNYTSRLSSRSGVEIYFSSCSTPPPASSATTQQRLVLSAIAAACADVSLLLRTASTAQTGTFNACGDSQIAADVAADALVLERLRSSSAAGSGRCVVATVSSEEDPAERELGGRSYSVAYDPLDGSSVAGAGWAVGAIFGVWEGRGLVGRRGDEQAAACYAVFGPRTTLVVAAANSAGGFDGEASAKTVDEFLLNSAGKWALSRAAVRLDDAAADDISAAAADDDNDRAPSSSSSPSSSLPRYFAPANLRAARDNKRYSDLVSRFMESGATLRYTGALVADFHHILAKGSGVFLNPASRGSGSPAAPPKLRYLYEVAPLALIAEAAGGFAEDGDGRVLEKRAHKADARCVVAFGSRSGVVAAREALREGGGALSR